MALIHNDKPVSADTRKLDLHSGHGHHFRAKLVLVCITFPHFRQVFRANDQCFQSEIVLKYFCESRCRDCFSQADDIADHYSASLMQVVRCDLNGVGLEIQQVFPAFLIQLKGLYSHASFT